MHDWNVPSCGDEGDEIGFDVLILKEVVVGEVDAANCADWYIWVLLFKFLHYFWLRVGVFDDFACGTKEGSKSYVRGCDLATAGFESTLQFAIAADANIEVFRL